MLPVMIAVLSPVSRPSSTAAIGKLTDFCPASITTEVGTVAAVVSLLARVIVIGWLAGLTIEMVPVVAPAGGLTDRLVGERQVERRDIVVDHKALSEPLWKPSSRMP